uniref:Secreted protein n=1 Tax=Plectus sambesii TaxID=2011161 RepID=A0A914XRJ5_9BILA
MFARFVCLLLLLSARRLAAGHRRRSNRWVDAMGVPPASRLSRRSRAPTATHMADGGASATSRAVIATPLSLSTHANVAATFSTSPFSRPTAPSFLYTCSFDRERSLSAARSRSAGHTRALSIG